MERLTLAIDGRPVSVAAGSTLLDAAREAGVTIPTLCDHPKLKPHGGCRLCVVEVEGSERLFASCVTPATAGMKVLTDTERVRAARRSVLELILAYHPLECPVCPQSGRCRLQDAAFEHGPAAGRFGSAPARRGVDRVSPLIENNQDRCILCGRCVRICDEVEGEGHLTFSGRGFPTVVATSFHRKWDCEFCGQCFQACPVGALYSRLFAHTAPLWELAPVRGACVFCGVGCTLESQVRKGRVHLVLGPAGEGTNQGLLCSKGRFGYQAFVSGERLTAPLARVEGRLVPVSWQEALTRAAEGVRAAIAASGPDSVGGIVSPLAANEDALSFVRFMRAGVGTNNVDSVSRWQHLPAALALRDAFGLAASTLSIRSLASSDLVFAVEANLTEDSHVAALGVMERARAGEARLLVAHGREIKLTRFASQWLRPLPGRAAGLLHAMAAALLEEGLEDKGFCRARVAGLPALRDSLAAHSPEKSAASIGVPAPAIREAARAFAAAKRAAIVLAPGSGSPFAAGELAAAAANLALLTGQVGREGAGVLLLPEYANSQGTLDMGASPGFLPGWQAVSDPHARGWYGKRWGAALPEAPGMDAAAMVRAAAEGRLSALLVMGEDLTRSFPDRALVDRALARLPFLAVSSLFLTSTAEAAQVVFPAAAGIEREASVTSGDRRVQRLRRAVPPPGEAREEWGLFAALGAALGGTGSKARWGTVGEVTGEIAASVPAYAGLGPERLEAGGAHWPCPETGHPGVEVLHRERFFSGLGRLRPAPAPSDPEPVEGEPVEGRGPDRPFLLVTGTVRHHCGSLLTRAGGLSRITPEARAELHPDDAARLGVADDDPVRIAGDRGEVVARALVSGRAQKGTVFLPVHFPAVRWNELVGFDDAGAPVPVSVEKAGGS